MTVTAVKEVQPDVCATTSNKSILAAAAIFIFLVGSLAFIYLTFPSLEPEERAAIKLPWNVEEAKNLGRVLDRYKQKYYIQVLSAIFFSYIFLQTFAIPGSISLSVLCGFLFPFSLAITLVCFCSATGASMCYFLSYNFGRKILYKYFSERIDRYSKLVEKNKDDMFNYVVFLRITPVLPNWFINLTAPILGVPFIPFWLGTFIGVAPPSFVAIQAGQTLYELSSIGGTWSWKSITLLILFSIISIIPVLVKRKLKSKLE